MCYVVEMWVGKSIEQFWLVFQRNALAAVLILIIPSLNVFIYHKKTVNSYLNSMENRSLDMMALSDNFCIEIFLQMNYFRKNKTTLMMFWPI